MFSLSGNTNEVCNANGHAYVRPVLVRIRERYVHLHWPNVVVGEKRKFWSAFENIQTIVKYDFLNIFKHLKVFVLNLENFKLVCFLHI